MGDMDDLKARFERMAIEAAEHAATCKAEECSRCGRHKCRCGTSVASEGMLCEVCRRKRVQTNWTRAALTAIPRAFSDITLDAEWLTKLVGTKVIAEARAALAHERVVATGLPGTGKTSLVAAMFVGSETRTTKPELMWVSAHEIAKARAFHPLGSGEAPLIQRALETELLVIDELGGEDARYASAVGEVIYERHAWCRATWLTTGVGPDKIAERYGGGIARRVFEDATVFRLGKRA